MSRAAKTWASPVGPARAGGPAPHPGPPPGGPALAAGHVLETLERPARPGLDLRREQSPGTHEAHVAGDDVPELRQLVQSRGAQQAPHAGDAAVTLGGLQWAPALVGVGDHGPELPAPEAPAAEPHALLPVEDGSAVARLDGD